MAFWSWPVRLIAILSTMLLLAAHRKYYDTAGMRSDSRSDINQHASHLARSIPAAELLSRPRASKAGLIPKLFHQSWKTLELPSKFAEWSLSCRQKHPDWEWVLWTDEDNLQLVQLHFPWLEEIYRNLPGVIYQADLMRYLYMYIYGGVYADLDTECLQSTEILQQKYGPLFDNSPPPAQDIAIFGRMGTIPDFEHSIPNAWMAAAPGHPFFLAAIWYSTDLLNQTLQSNRSFASPESLTGPVALRKAIAQYEKDKVLHGNRISNAVSNFAARSSFVLDSSRFHKLLLLPNHLIYPYSWGTDGELYREVCWVLRDSFDAEVCKKHLGVYQIRSISITYWSHSHSPHGHNADNMKHIE